MDAKYTRNERIADGCVHAAGLLAGLVGCVALLVGAVPSQPVHATVSLAVYGATMLAMFGCSAAYHMLPAPTWKSALRRMDQAAIFLKIAGTYTPFASVTLGGAWGYGLLGVVWTIALGGAAAKLSLAARWDRVSLALYLILGWASLIALAPLLGSAPAAAVALLVAGGVLYTAGVAFHLWDSLPYQNAIWHLFVLAGTACHFAAVAIAVFN